MTAGQHDILRGTYSADFINRNAQCFSIDAPGLLDRRHVEVAMLAMEAQHPVLRTVPLRVDGEWRQEILPPGSGDTAGRLVMDEVGPGHVSTRTTELVSEMVEQFDVFERPSWGVLQIRTAGVDRLVFVFNHFAADLIAVSQFVRSFVAVLVLGDRAELLPDTYETYLAGLEQRWEEAPSADARWWMDRPWGDIPPLPGLRAVAGAPRLDPPEFVDLLPQQDLPHGKLSEAMLVGAVEKSIRDVSGVSVARVDAARVGRNNHVERSASGWLSHALPFVTTSGASLDELTRARETADSWITAFRRVRGRPDLTTEDHFSAHVFLNFFGTFSPDKWTYEGFRVSRDQPAYKVPGRSSVTPVHLKVRKAGDRWALSWALSPQYDDSELLGELSLRTRELLTRV